ncbi:putative hydrolase [Paramyrothecium foliicola]|nr:putative hydrolase [Paramyrothecium foliicola]
MEKALLSESERSERSEPLPGAHGRHGLSSGLCWKLRIACLAGLVCVLNFGLWSRQQRDTAGASRGHFPEPNDPFRFLPCTNATILPALDDANPSESWAQLYDPDPEHWSWGNPTEATTHGADPYHGRGLYLCGYLEVPFDYKNVSDKRAFRLAVTKFQVSGLGAKSERTIVIEPGGPGGGGVSYAWRVAEDVTKRLSQSQFDVLGWDPRGVNSSLPAVSCFPHDSDRDRWALLRLQFREVSTSPRAQLEAMDAMNDAMFRACKHVQGDLPRFVTTALVARDLEEIRIALDEDELTGYLVSYGTGIGQTYANMFPNSVGRIILDGTEYVRDHRLLGGFGWTALDNGTDAWHDGFLGECVNAGPAHCALAKPPNVSHYVTVEELENRMTELMKSLIKRPIAGYTDFSGPSLITYSVLVEAIYSAMYNAKTWPALAQMLFELEQGNSTLAAEFLEHLLWKYDPTIPPSPVRWPASDDLTYMVICGDSYDAPLPAEGLDWFESLWENMTDASWIAGNSRFFDILPCLRFTEYWPEPAEVYRGDLNHTLKNPILLIAETYDPATPLRNGRRLLNEMGKNARLIAHHGYGHASRDSSNCTDTLARSYILSGVLPDVQETACFANEKPYLYGVTTNGVTAAQKMAWDPIQDWRAHLKEIGHF